MPLTRASVLARARVADPGRRAAAGLRREGAGKADQRVSGDDDPMFLLEGALRLAASEKELLPAQHGVFMCFQYSSWFLFFCLV